jgi:hypothetical protein
LGVFASLDKKDNLHQRPNLSLQPRSAGARRNGVAMTAAPRVVDPPIVTREQGGVIIQTFPASSYRKEDLEPLGKVTRLGEVWVVAYEIPASSSYRYPKKGLSDGAI